jgi:hypothetical protein
MLDYFRNTADVRIRSVGAIVTAFEPRIGVGDRSCIISNRRFGGVGTERKVAWRGENRGKRY